MRQVFAAVVFAIGLSLGASTAEGQVTVEVVDTVPDGFRAFVPRRISGDGTTVVGRLIGENSFTDPDNTGARWRAGTGFQVIDGLFNRDARTAPGVSQSGSVVVGDILEPNPANPGNINAGFQVPYVWTEQGGMVALDTPRPGPGVSRGRTNAVNADGSVITGIVFLDDSTGRAARWVDGTVEVLSAPGGQVYSSGDDVNADGSVVCGIFVRATGERFRTFRWTATGGFVDIGVVTPPNGGNLLDVYLFQVSSDGNTLFGYVTVIQAGQIRNYPARWTVTGGLELIGDDLAGVMGEGQIMGSSADGSVLVGVSQGAGGLIEPAFWTESDGWTTLASFLADNGVEPPPGTALEITDISDDGLVMLVRAVVPDVAGVFWVIRKIVDADGDGLLDDWEINGIPYTDGNGVAQRLMLSEADPQHKDLYVEIDSMVGRGFDEIAQLDVIVAFATVPNALVNNPDGRDGIALHLIVDEVDLPLVPFPNDFVDFDNFKAKHFGTPAEHGNAPLLAAKAKAYRYCVFGQSYGTTDSSGLAELPGNDFMVTLGLWPTPGGTVDQQAGTFMHEFGHTLGLEHGGGDETNYKPNYYSVMNYRWQSPQAAYPHLWRLDYSREALPPLVESALNESISLGATLPEYAAVFVPFTTAANTFAWASLATGGTVDWDGDGATAPGQPPVAADINRGDPSDPPGDLETLTSHNDWANLHYALSGHPNFGEGRTTTTIDDEFDVAEFEINEKIPPPPAACLPDFTGDGVLNFFDVSAYLVAFQNQDPIADFNPDGVFNFFDVAAFVAAFSAGCP